MLHLELTCCPQGHAVVEALLQQANALEELQLRMSFLGTPERGQLPPALLARGGLRALRLPHMCLEELPAGAYLLGEWSWRCLHFTFAFGCSRQFWGAAGPGCCPHEQPSQQQVPVVLDTLRQLAGAPELNTRPAGAPESSPHLSSFL